MTPTEPESIVLEALMTRLKTLSSPLPMADPGITLDPVPADRKYLRVSLIPNQTGRMTVDSDGPSRHMGIFQVTVNWPVGRGEIEPREYAGRVASLFATDVLMTYGSVIVRSTKRPDVGPSIPDPKGVDLLTPVSVEYESYI